MKKRTLFMILASLCMVMAMIAFTGCGGDSSGEAGSEEAAVEKSTTEAADPMEKFVGSWSLAAAESQGVIMSGDFSELIGMEDDGMMKLEADGTGSMSLGDDPVKFTWALKDGDENTIDLKAEDDTEMTDENFSLRYEDEALLLEMKDDEQEGTAIFTHDGKYPGAIEINMDEATDITSEDELIGKWKMSAMKMMGISIYGSEEALENISGGTDMSIDFQKGGVAVMDEEKGSWEVGKDGATMTPDDITGTHTYPIKKLGDDIVIDMSEVMAGQEFLMLLKK